MGWFAIMVAVVADDRAGLAEELSLKNNLGNPTDTFINAENEYRRIYGLPFPAWAHTVFGQRQKEYFA